MKIHKEIFKIESANQERIDCLLTKRFENYSRAYFQELIENQMVLVNGKPLKKRVVPVRGDEISVLFRKRPGPDLTPQDIPLEILYEDAHIIAINKPANMVVHPAPGNWSSTFVNALLNHCSVYASSEYRPGIVHRLDKETSGVLIAAKTEIAHQKLVELFAQRKIEKEYIAIALGKVSSKHVSLPIARCKMNRKKMAICHETGKEAITDIELLAFNGTFSKVQLRPKTGRTHQLRVHLKHLGNPILGDKVYGSTSINEQYGAKRHYLHAVKLTLNHPITQDRLEIQAPLPKEMDEIFLCGF